MWFTGRCGMQLAEMRSSHWHTNTSSNRSALLRSVQLCMYMICLDKPPVSWEKCILSKPLYFGLIVVVPSGETLLSGAAVLFLQRRNFLQTNHSSVCIIVLLWPLNLLRFLGNNYCFYVIIALTRSCSRLFLLCPESENPQTDEVYTVCLQCE